ncbi:hypothetical protein ODZ83_00800 [Acaricomes phytoseiuli]|uniref:hypothetical protein n=1 Tax=Acaricomes phytoseiuli TaxID=291968 RepID=UPI00037496FB|nr:hypothetical protein [Acaricomes phytoseiuli]MCW1248751.1 hypothetical protein [Acaricomes phytoseiuli]
MSIDPGIALQALTAALEDHLAAVRARRGEDDPAVEAAYSAIIEAFDAYEDLLYENYGEVTPLVIDEEEDSDEDGDGTG